MVAAVLNLPLAELPVTALGEPAIFPRVPLPTLGGRRGTFAGTPQ